MDVSEIQTREFEEGDLDRLQQIREAAFAPIFHSLREMVGPKISSIALASEEKEQAELLANLCDPKSPGKVFVAMLDGMIIGFVSISLDHEKRIGEIGLNAVHPDFSGEGAGTHLYKFAVKKCAKRGCWLLPTEPAAIPVMPQHVELTKRPDLVDLFQASGCTIC